MLGRITIAGGALVVALMTMACAQPAATPAGPAAAEKAMTVRTAPAARADLVSSFTYTGDVRAKSSLSVVPKVPGRVEKINVDLGSVVKVGDVIAELEKDTARLAVQQAEAGLAQARARLATLQAGPRPETVAQAQAAARAARARVDALQQAGRPETIAQAQAGLDAARLRVTGLRNPRPESIAGADANVAAAEARFDQAKKGATPQQLRSIEIGIEQARNGLYAVQVQKDAACGRSGGVACDTLRRQSAAAEESVRAAEQQLKIAMAPPTAETLAQVQAGVDQARLAARLARQPASDQDIAQAENGVRAAEAALSLAKSPVMPSDLAAVRALAEAAEAGAKLAAAPYTRHDIEQADAAVAQLEATVELARLAIKETTVLAPVAGIVTDRFLVVGSSAAPTSPIVAIATNELEVAVTVEEAQIGRFQVGQEARVTVAARPGEAFDGKLTLVAPTVDARTRTATLKITPTDAAIGKLRPGMFAQVSLQTARRSGALVIPRSAILPGDTPEVFVVEGDTVKRVAIELGVQERDRVEVLRGVAEGDRVVLDAVDLRDGTRVAIVAER